MNNNNNIPNDLIPEEQVPSDLRQPNLAERVAGVGSDVTEWVRNLPRNFVTRPMSPPVPSPTTAATMVIPGAGPGVQGLKKLIPALSRIGTATVGRGAEAAAAGKDPLAAGLTGGAIQGATEAIVPGANAAVGAAKKYGPTALSAASTVLPGAAARSNYYLAKTMERSARASDAAKTPAGEYMGKYGPTGIPASKLLAPSGRPITPAVDPRVVPHKDLRGWTLLDVLNQSGPAAAPTGKGSIIEMLLRLGSAGAQEGAQ